jgi:Rod binding domain-containing protein
MSVRMDAAPDAATLARPGAAKAWQAAKAFEAMALGQFLAPMFETVDPAKSLFGGGAGESVWRPMLVNQMAKQVAAQGGLGLAMPVFSQLLRMQEGKAPA